MKPFPIGYGPTEDVTTELEPELDLYYQLVIGVLRWMVELGQIDINTEILMLDPHLASPRDGHLEAVFNVLSYIWAR